MTHQFPFGVGDVDDHWTGGRRLQPEIDHCPVGRILAGRLFWRKWRVGVVVATETVAQLRREKISIGFGHLGSDLPKWSDVVENPERAPMRSDYDVIVMDHQIANRRGRKIEAQRLPMISVIKGDIHRALTAGKKKTLALDIFPDGVYRFVVGQSADNLLPAAAAVVRAINIRMKIVQAEPVHRGIGGICVEV